MSINLTINGVAYPFPVQGDSPPWGSQVTAWAQAVTGGMLQKAGGTFTLTADVDFGGSYGLKALKFSTRTANPASSGLVRLANNEAGIAWRDAANLNNLVLKVNASDQLEFNGVPIGGAASYTADRAIVSNGSGQLTAATTTATEIGYVNGVTSPIQTQLDGKQATGNYITALTGDVTATGPGSVAATIANLAVTTGKIDNLAVTAGKIANDTITNTQVNSAAAIAVSKLAALTASRAVVTDASGFISAATTTAAEIGYVNGVTSAIQTQIDSKVGAASPSFTGTLTVTQGTAGNAVQVLQSTHADGNPSETVYQNTHEGTGGGLTTIITIPVTAGQGILIDAVLVGYDLGGGGADEVGSVYGKAVARNVGGTVTVRGTPDVGATGDGGVFSSGITFTASGTNVLVRVNFTGSTNIRGTARVYPCG